MVNQIFSTSKIAFRLVLRISRLKQKKNKTEKKLEKNVEIIKKKSVAYNQNSPFCKLQSEICYHVKNTDTAISSFKGIKK